MDLKKWVKKNWLHIKKYGLLAAILIILAPSDPLTDTLVVGPIIALIGLKLYFLLLAALSIIYVLKVHPRIYITEGGKK